MNCRLRSRAGHVEQLSGHGLFDGRMGQGSLERTESDYSEQDLADERGDTGFLAEEATGYGGALEGCEGADK